MKYYSTNKKAPIADLHKAVVKGLAEDRGLYMPEIIKKLPQDFFDTIENLDQRLIKPIFDEVSTWDEPVCIAVLPDHPTPVEIRTHVKEPVPFIIYYPGIEPDSVEKYDEESCVSGSYGLLQLQDFMNAFMAIK